MSLISVIIPTFNRGDLIRETLISLQNQTIDNWECIIVDDGSTDNTDVNISEFTTVDKRFIYIKRAVEPKGSIS